MARTFSTACANSSECVLRNMPITPTVFPEIVGAQLAGDGEQAGHVAEGVAVLKGKLIGGAFEVAQ